MVSASLKRMSAAWSIKPARDVLIESFRTLMNTTFRCTCVSTRWNGVLLKSATANKRMMHNTALHWVANLRRSMCRAFAIKPHNCNYGALTSGKKIDLSQLKPTFTNVMTLIYCYDARFKSRLLAVCIISSIVARSLGPVKGDVIGADIPTGDIEIIFFLRAMHLSVLTSLNTPNFRNGLYERRLVRHYITWKSCNYYF
jgi:hypothetical protein